MTIKHLVVALILLPGSAALADVPYHHYCHGSVRAEAQTWYQLSTSSTGVQTVSPLSAKPADCGAAQILHSWSNGLGDVDINQTNPAPDTAPVDGNGSVYHSISSNVQYGSGGVLGELLGTFFEGPPFKTDPQESMDQQLQSAKTILDRSVTAMTADTTYVTNQISSHSAQMAVDASQVKNLSTHDVQISTTTLTATQTALNQRPPVAVPYPTSPAGLALQGLRENENRVAIAQKIPPDALLPDKGSMFGILDGALDSSFASSDHAERDLIHEERKLAVTTPSAGHEDQLALSHALLTDATMFQPSPGDPSEQIVESLVDEAQQRRFAAQGLLTQPQFALWDGYAVSVGTLPPAQSGGPIAMHDVVTNYVQDQAAATKALHLAAGSITLVNQYLYKQALSVADLSDQLWRSGHIVRAQMLTMYALAAGQRFLTTSAPPEQLTDAEVAEVSKDLHEVGQEIGVDFENETLVELSDFHETPGAQMVVGATRSFIDVNQAIYNAATNPSDENNQKVAEEGAKMGIGFTVTGVAMLVSRYLPETLPVRILLTIGGSALTTAIKNWLLSLPEEQNKPAPLPSQTPPPMPVIP